MTSEIKQITNTLEQIEKAGRHTVFYTYSGHVKHFSIRVFRGKWTERKKPIINMELKLHSDHFIDLFDYMIVPMTTDEIIAKLEQKTIKQHKP